MPLWKRCPTNGLNIESFFLRTLFQGTEFPFTRTPGPRIQKILINSDLFIIDVYILHHRSLKSVNSRTLIFTWIFFYATLTALPLHIHSSVPDLALQGRMVTSVTKGRTQKWLPQKFKIVETDILRCPFIGKLLRSTFWCDQLGGNAFLLSWKLR
jgi:hypothetical protein